MKNHKKKVQAQFICDRQNLQKFDAILICAKKLEIVFDACIGKLGKKIKNHKAQV